MPGDITGGFRGRAHRGWSQYVGAGAGAAGLLVVAGCTGAGPAAPGAAAKVTIVSGNLTFSSAGPGMGRLAAPAHRAGDAIVAGLSGSGARDTASGGT